MFESLVVTLREGIEAALAVAILLACLNKTGRQALIVWVYVGIGAALLVSVAGTWILSRLDIPEELREGSLMLAAAVVVGSMVVWMWHHARHLKGEIEEKLTAALAGREGVGAAIGVFLFTFLLIVREGMETAVFMSAMSVNSGSVMNIIGAVIGLSLAVAFGVFLVKGSVRIDIARFLKVTAVILMVLVVQLLIGGVHEFSEYGLIKMTPRMMAVIGPLVRNNVFFVLAVLALPLILMFIPGRRQMQEQKDLESLAAAERRLQISQRKRDRMYRLLSASTAVLIMGFLSMHYVYSKTPTADPPQMLTAHGSRVSFPANEISDGKMRRYGVQMGSGVVRFIAIKTEQGPKVALDACEMCGTIGYVPDNNGVMCLNCTAEINTDSIGLKGGCNPTPLEHAAEVVDGNVVVQLADLQAAAPLFHAQVENTKVSCAVCGMKFDANQASKHEGRVYICTMPGCISAFKAHPDKYR